MQARKINIYITTRKKQKITKEPEKNVQLQGNGKSVHCKAAPYGDMQNGSHGEKENGRESKAKGTIVETEGDKLSRSI